MSKPVNYLCSLQGSWDQNVYSKLMRASNNFMRVRFFVWVATPVRYLACGLSVCVSSVKFGVTAPRRAYEAPVACAFDWGHETVFPRLRMRRIRTQPLARDSKVLYPSPMSTDAYATVGKGSMYCTLVACRRIRTAHEGRTRHKYM